MTPVELIKFDIKCALQILGHQEQEIRMTGDVVEPDLHIPEPEFNFAGVPILMKATKTFHIENRVSREGFCTCRHFEDRLRQIKIDKYHPSIFLAVLWRFENE